MAATKNTPSARKSTAAKKKKPVRREVGAAVCLLVGLFGLIGYFVQDYWLIDALCLYVFKGLFGWGFLVIPPVFLWAAVVLFFHHGRPIKKRLIAIFLVPLFFGAIVHLFACQKSYGVDFLSLRSLYLDGINMGSAGLIGGFLAVVLLSAVSLWGAAPVLFLGLMAALFLGGNISLRKTVDDMKNHEFPAYEPEPELEKPRRSRKKKAEEAPLPAADARPLPPSDIFDTTPATEPRRRRSRREAIDIPIDDMPEPEEDIPDMPVGPLYYGPDEALYTPASETTAEEVERGRHERRRKPAEPAPVYDDTDASYETDTLFLEDEPPAPEIREPRQSVTFVPPQELKKPSVRTEIDAFTGEITSEIEGAGETESYTYPPVTLLCAGSGTQTDARAETEQRRDRLEAALHSFGIRAAVCGITRGPTVTRYDLELEAGVKLSKLTNLANDLALSLGVTGVRIAPIPDKSSTVGVEVPNKAVSTVLLRDIIESPAFTDASSRLTFAIGKDIGGNCIVGNISKLPHMLIAGTTGSGKSVCMNSLILSLLYKSTPDEVRLVMIDPKMVELGIYNGIPHLYVPVVTDPKKAAGALQWSVVEMMKRYQRFSDAGVRDLTGYNRYMRNNGGETMPSIVIVIDELADLMITAAKEVEESICRVAQMGRAAGMHLVIATQRPSSDVITGLMKANIPSRIAFAVSSSLESRIILDQNGAEKLIGKGDMLYAPIGCGKPMRVQGAFVSDEEREDVIRFIKRDSSANYDDDVLQQIEKAAAGTGKGSVRTESDERDPDDPFADCDPLLTQAVEIVMDTKQGSVSMLQRKLKVGFSRAGRIMDEIEELGIVGPAEGSKPRQVLITREQWQEMSMRDSRTPMERLAEEQTQDELPEEDAL